MDTARNRKVDPKGAGAAGRVKIDSRGRNVWQWNDDQVDSTTIMLQRLDNDALAIEPTLKVKKPEISRERPKARARTDRPAPSDSAGIRIEQTLSIDLGGGFDPYNNR